MKIELKILIFQFYKTMGVEVAQEKPLKWSSGKSTFVSD